MWRLTQGISDQDLIRSGPTSYGTVIIGKLRLPLTPPNDDLYIHVRIHDPPLKGEGTNDVTFHSIFTEETRGAGEEYNAVFGREKGLEFFSE
ncbi:hypothetical protein MNV49_005521 [Pseudohyphozyma bogoriensis]|nr:hypothetical protein MNV49_005521 [Pseudohyphozyma bogoriensis]